MTIPKKRLNEIASYKDELIDTSEIPELNKEFWKNAKVIRPDSKVPVSLRLDQNVLTWFKNKGKGYQSHINSVLTSYMKAHESTT